MSRQPGRHRPGRVPLVSVPSSLRTAQLRVRPAAVWGLVLLVIAVAAVLGVRVAWAERSAQPTPVPVSPAAADPGSSELGPEEGSGAEGAAPGDDAGPTQSDRPGEQGDSTSEQADLGPHSGQEPGHADTATAPGPLVVHVIGAVRRPGVVPLPRDARVTDAVDRAGGLSDDADLSRINLARAVTDGERIWVPVRGQEPPEDVAGNPLAPPGAAPGAAENGASGVAPGQGGAGAGGSATPLVDLNSADQPLLETLPGVGPVTAQRILQWRTDHGRFSAPEELLEVSGIGPRTLERLQAHITVGGDR